MENSLLDSQGNNKIEMLLNEFKDLINDMEDRYNKVKCYIINDNGELTIETKDDLNDLDEMIKKLYNYKDMSIESYVELLNNLALGIDYLKKDSNLDFNLSLLNLSMFVNIFTLSCMGKFQILFDYFNKPLKASIKSENGLNSNLANLIN